MITDKWPILKKKYIFLIIIIIIIFWFLIQLLVFKCYK